MNEIERMNKETKIFHSSNSYQDLKTIEQNATTRSERQKSFIQ